MRIAAPGRTGWVRWGYRDGWAIVIRNSTGLDMRAPLAARAADRISRSAILVAGVLCGALVFFVAIPLALSNPFPTLKEAEWVVHRSSLHIKVPMSEMVEAQALFDPVSSMPSPQAAAWQRSPASAQDQPSSRRQSALQPSALAWLPSSHCSLAATTPSPQRAIARHGLPGFGQLNPRSTIRQFA